MTSTETVTVETVSVSTTATDTVVVDTSGVETVVVGIAGPQGPAGSGGGGGAPTDATYLVASADGDLTDAVVVGTTPGGELGGTWASPTVDATHSGSSHASVQAAAEATAAAALTAHEGASDPHPGYLTAAEGNAAYEAAGAVSTHSADTTSVHGIADTSALVTTSSAPELIRDTIGSALVAGSNVTITVSDPGDTITIAATGSGGASALDDLTDVTITSPAAGATLIYDGAGWVDGKLDLADADAVTGVLPDANIASTIARDSEVAAAYQPLDADLTAIAAVTGTRGDILYYGASGWTDLAKGTAGQHLGIGANDPAWSSRFGRVIHTDNGVAQVNTASEVSLLSATHTITGNSLSVGDVLWVRAQGIITNNTGANRSITWQIGPDAATCPTLATGNIATGATSRIWNLDVFIRVETVASGQLYHGNLAISTVGGSTTWDVLQATGYYYIINTAGTYSFASDVVFDLRVTMSAADFTVDCYGFSLVMLPKAI